MDADVCFPQASIAQYFMPQGQNEDLVRALLADKEMLHVPDNTGLLPLGLAVARGYHKTARVILGHDT